MSISDECDESEIDRMLKWVEESQNNQTSVIYVSSLPDYTRVHDLRNRFMRFGDVRDVRLKKGYAVLDYANEIEAQSAIDEMHGQYFMGRRIQVEKYLSIIRSSEKIKNEADIFLSQIDAQSEVWQVFVRNVSLDASYNHLYNIFISCGDILDITIKKGCAFINFQNSAGVEFAVFKSGYKLLNQEIIVERAREDYFSKSKAPSELSPFKQENFPNSQIVESHYDSYSPAFSSPLSTCKKENRDSDRYFSSQMLNEGSFTQSQIRYNSTQVLNHTPINYISDSEEEMEIIKMEEDMTLEDHGGNSRPDLRLKEDIAPSSEQMDIIEASKEKNTNIMINCCAGSGKTTTALFIAKANPGKKHLLLTYNSKLKIDTKRRISKELIKNLECHTYHSFFFKYFSQSCYNDTGLKLTLNNRIVPIPYDSQYNVIIMDEIQDCSISYYEAALCIISYLKTNKIPKLIIMGDSRQSIYEYHGANRLFLEEAKLIWNLDEYSHFKELSLRISYRLTIPMAGFINECLVGSNIIKAIKPGKNVRYLITDVFERAIDEVDYYIKKLNGDLENIFVLAPSLKSDNPIKNPVNTLADLLTIRTGVKIFVPPSDGFPVKESELRGKIAFLSFHQAKGLERDAVIVFSFDSSYFQYYCRDGDPEQLPNAMYVAITRARKYLSVLHSHRRPYLDFLKPLYLAKWCKVIGKLANNVNQPPKSNSIPKTVINLLRHIPDEIIDDCAKMLKIKQLKKGTQGDFYNLKTMISGEGGNTKEGVAEINGISIPAFFELKTTDRMTILDLIREKFFESKMTNNDLKIEDFIKKSPSNQIDYDIIKYMILNKDPKPIMKRVVDKNKVDLLLILATIYLGLNTGFNHKNNQIQKYDWLSKNDLHSLVKRLEMNISHTKNLIFELIVTSDFPSLENGDADYVLTGIADIVSHNKKEIWEIKCCSETSSVHLLQLALYMYLFYKDFGKKYKGILYNVITDDLIEVTNIAEDLERMSLILLRYHTTVKVGLPSTQSGKFIEKCLAIRNKYVLPAGHLSDDSSLEMEIEASE